MPFKLFGSSKKNRKESSSAGTDAVDQLSEQAAEEPPDCEVKASSKSILHFFSAISNKNSNHVHFKGSNKDKKVKNGGSLGGSKKTKSLTHIPSNDKEDAAHSADQSNNNHLLHSDQRPAAKSQGRPKRSASYGTFMDSLTRERRLLDIVQLDNYMEYLRHTEDEGNLANRLCCAQVLKLGLIRIEMAHRHSQERLDRTSPVNGVSQRTQKHPHQTKNKHTDESDLDSNHSDRKEDDRGLHRVTFGSDSDSRESEQDSGSEPDPDQEFNCGVQESCSRSTFRVKSKKTPVWPSDIEIF